MTRNGFATQTVLKVMTLLIGLAVALIGLEILSTGWLTIRDGQYVSASKRFDGFRNSYIQDITRGGNCRYVDTMFPHPYLAFVHHHDNPCGVPDANNIGLLGDDFPVVRNNDRYVVLVTGGSVASQLAHPFDRSKRSFLERELNRHYVSPTGKPFQVLNGALGAWKQPQQMILFAIYGEFVDVVVTLDGYNEQYLTQPGMLSRFELPAANYLNVNPIIAKDGFGGLAVSWLMGRAAGWLSDGITAHSQAAYLIATALAGRPLDDSSGAKTYADMLMLPKNITSSPSALMDWQAAQYAKYIRVMDVMARDFGIKAMFFLQPVPAVSKTLTEEERRRLPDVDYGSRYAEIVRRLLALRDRNIEVRSLLDIFKNEKGTIYVDDIHPQRDGGESYGYSLIATQMAHDMASAWGWRAKQ